MKTARGGSKGHEGRWVVAHRHGISVFNTVVVGNLDICYLQNSQAQTAVLRLVSMFCGAGGRRFQILQVRRKQRGQEVVLQSMETTRARANSQ